jgi:hypothetical protein
MNYYGNLHKARNFMSGDNFTAMMSVQTAQGKAVYNGNANITLYNPSNIGIGTLSTNTINNTLNFKTNYTYDSSILYEFSSGDTSGKYLLVGYWFNGSECGIEFIDIFKVNYSILEYTSNELFETGENQLYGSFSSGVSQTIPTNIFHASIDQFNKTAISVEPNMSTGNINFSNFIQSESIYNPGEQIDFSVEIKSLDLAFTHDINLWVEIYQSTQDDRIIVKNSTSSPITLNYIGGIGSTQIINFTNIFPTNLNGYNTPIRHTLYQTRVCIEVDGELKITWESNETYSTILDDNATDGSIITIKDRYNRTGNTFSQVFDRDTETLFNQETLYLMMLESYDGTSLESQVSTAFTNNMQSYFENLTITPSEGSQMTMNNDFILEGDLYLENNILFPSEVS